MDMRLLCFLFGHRFGSPKVVLTLEVRVCARCHRSVSAFDRSRARG
jgi:Prophage protein (DUF1660)